MGRVDLGVSTHLGRTQVSGFNFENGVALGGHREETVSFSAGRVTSRGKLLLLR